MPYCYLCSIISMLYPPTVSCPSTLPYVVSTHSFVPWVLFHHYSSAYSRTCTRPCVCVSDQFTWSHVFACGVSLFLSWSHLTFFFFFYLISPRTVSSLILRYKGTVVVFILSSRWVANVMDTFLAQSSFHNSVRQRHSYKVRFSVTVPLRSYIWKSSLKAKVFHAFWNNF